ncbi:MAG: type II secretion system F family protein [Phycisphaerales bacterium JB039]
MTRSSGAHASFLYLAAKPAGGRSLGVRTAASERALAAGLGRDRLLLLRAWKLPGWAARSGELRLRDQATLNDTLGQLVSRGVPLVEALEVTASAVRPDARALVLRMREMVAGGASFADACAQTRAFDQVTVAVYRGAERTGDLGGACQQLARTARRQLQVGSKAATLLAYPAIVLSICALVTTGMIVFIVPRIGEALEQAGADIPLVTRALVATGLFIQDNWLLVLAAVLGLLFLIVLLRSAIGGAIWAVARRLPGMRDLILAQESARFFSVMAAMTRSGVTIADALGVAYRVVSHPKMRRELAALQRKLVAGGVLARLIEGVQTLPLATRRLLIAAERSGDMERAFDSLATDMADEVDTRAQRLLAMLEPLLIVLMFAIIGSIVMAIMIPMLTLTVDGM